MKRQEKKEKKKMSASKKLMLFLFINCSIIELFTLFIIFYSFPFAAAIGVLPDFSPLTTLISTVVAETISFGIYSLKATKENTKGGIVYDATIQALENNSSIPLINNGGNNNDID